MPPAAVFCHFVSIPSRGLGRRAAGSPCRAPSASSETSVNPAVCAFRRPLSHALNIYPRRPSGAWIRAICAGETFTYVLGAAALRYSGGDGAFPRLSYSPHLRSLGRMRRLSLSIAASSAKALPPPGCRSSPCCSSPVSSSLQRSLAPSSPRTAA